MNERRRSPLIVVVLAVGLLLCSLVAAYEVETSVLGAVQGQLADAGVPYYGLQVDGRDVVLAGFVSDAAQAQALVDLVRQVEGVRRVRSELVVERVVAAAPVAARELRVRRDAATLYASGQLSIDDANALRAAFESLFGAGNVRWSVRTLESAGSAFDRRDADTLVEAFGLAGPSARMAMRGQQLILSGEVDSAARQRAVADRLTSLPDLQASAELLVLPRRGVRR